MNLIMYIKFCLVFYSMINTKEKYEILKELQ